MRTAGCAVSQARWTFAAYYDAVAVRGVHAGYGANFLAWHAGMHNVSFNWERPLEFLPGALG